MSSMCTPSVCAVAGVSPYSEKIGILRRFDRIRSLRPKRCVVAERRDASPGPGALHAPGRRQCGGLGAGLLRPDLAPAACRHALAREDIAARGRIARLPLVL